MASRQISGAEFDKEIATGMSVVDFFATWCGPCKMMAPVLEAVSETHPDIKFLKIDIDQDMDIAMKYKVMSVPTLIVFKDGEIYKKSIGAISGAELEELLV